MSSLLWPILGAARFFLALIVAGTHLMWFVPHSPLATGLNRLSAIVAVFGFLMISGFSIAASYAKQPKGYYGRRVLRIIPLYLLAIAAGVVCTMPFGGQIMVADGGIFRPPALGMVLQNLFFLQGFTTSSILTNGVIWSLSVEVLFYLLTPLLARLSQTSLLLIAGASLALFIGASWYALPDYPAMQGGLAVVLLGWCWLAGFIAFRHGNYLEASWAILIISMSALSIYTLTLSLNWPVTLAVVAAAIGLGNRLHGPRRLGAVLTLLGDASYPLYLFHLPLFFVLAGLQLPLPAIGYLAAALLLAIALDQLYDRPLKRLLRHLGPADRAAGRGV